MALKPLTGLTKKPALVRVKLIRRYDGRAQMRVTFNGHQRTINFNYGARYPFDDAVLAAFDNDSLCVIMADVPNPDVRVFEVSC